MPKARVHLLVAIAGVSLWIGGCGGSSGHATNPRGPSPTASAGAWSVTSSIHDGAVLSGHVPWQVSFVGIDPVHIQGVDYVVDGRKIYTSTPPGFVFGEDTSVFTAEDLRPGPHTLTVVARSSDGRSERTDAHVTVRALSLTHAPNELLGSWTRVVTQADIQRTQSFRTEVGVDLAAALLGRMTLVVDTVGLHWRHPPVDFATGGVFGAQHTLCVLPAYDDPYRHERGHFCTQASTGSYRWSVHGTMLTVTLLHDTCADLVSTLVGQWRRT